MLSELLQILGGLLIVGCVYVAFRFWRNYSSYSHIPGVTQLGPLAPFPMPSFLNPYIGTGNDPANLTPLFKTIAKGGVLRITGPDATRIIVGDPEVIKDVAIRKADSFTKPQIYDLLNIFGPNIVSLNDSPWKRHRVVADPAFAEDHMDFLSKSSYHCAQLAIEKMETKKKSNRLIIDVHSEMQLVTLDIIGKVAFGYDFGVFDAPPVVAPHTMTFVDAIKSTMTLGIVVGGILPTWTQFMFPYTKRGIQETESYMRELISYRLKNMTENRHDLLSLLVSSNAEQIAEKSLTEQELIADVFIFLLAGHETSATTLNWMTYELCLQPEIQEKMYEEVVRVLGDEENPSMEKYYELTYMRNAVQETLRKHPPISFIPKLNKVKTKIGDYIVPANTEVYLNSYQAQHDERYWKNPKVYMPERFEPSNENYTKPPSGAWIPFSIGQRKCIGNRFSEIETAMIMARMVKKYRFELPKDDPKMQTKAWLSGHPPTEEILTLRPSGMMVELIERTK